MRKHFCTSLALAVATLAACTHGDASADAPLAPPGGAALARAHGKPRATWTASALTRDVPLAEDVVLRQVVDARGGTLELRALGLRVEVPAGAVLAPMTIQITAVAGEMIAYDFAPEGAVFTRPILVSQSVRGTSWERLKKSQRQDVAAGYFTDRSMLDHASGTARIAEVLATTPAWSGNEIQFPVHHFSGYMYSWGRSRIHE